MDPVQRRLEFQALLESVSGLSEDDVHFQPPTSIEMKWPAITYTRDRPKTDFADNIPYRSALKYTVTVIHKDPDNDIQVKVAAMPYCTFERSYPADGLNHDVFNIFF